MVSSLWQQALGRGWWVPGEQPDLCSASCLQAAAPSTLRSSW